VSPNAYQVESDEELTVALEQLSATAGCISQVLTKRDATVAPEPALHRAWLRTQKLLGVVVRQLEEMAYAG